MVKMALNKHSSNTDLEMRRQKSAFTAFRALSRPLQTILLSDLVRCGSPLQKVTPVWGTLFKFEVHKHPLWSAAGSNTQTNKFKF